MKKLLLLLTLLVATNVWALPDPVTSTEYTGSQQITTRGTNVFSYLLSYTGVTAGDKIQLIDSTTSTTTPIVRTIVASTANGSVPITFTAADRFNSGVYYKETKSGGNFTLDVQKF